MFGINFFNRGTDHHYVARTPLTRIQPGEDPELRTQEAFEQLVSLPAPGPTAPATAEGTLNRIPGLGSVISTVNREAGTVTNEAQPGHLLYPGTVTSSIVREGDVVYAQRVGTGTGALGRLNEQVSTPFWNLVDERIARRMNPEYVSASSQAVADAMLSADPSDPESTFRGAMQGFHLVGELRNHYLGS